MADFGFVKEQSIKVDATAKFTLYTIQMPDDTNPVLIGRYAGEANKPYYNAVLREQAKGVAAKQAALKAGAISAEMLAEGRELDRELFPKFVLTGWENVLDSEGKLVPFNEQNAADFLAALPNEDVDDVRNFFGTRTNFRTAQKSIISDEAIAEGNA